MGNGYQFKPNQTMDDLVTGCRNVGLGTPTRHPSAGTEWSHGTGSCLNEQRNWAATRQLAVAGIKANSRSVQFDGKDAAIYHNWRANLEMEVSGLEINAAEWLELLAIRTKGTAGEIVRRATRMGTLEPQNAVDYIWEEFEAQWRRMGRTG